jgi:hypothetical protein
LRLNARTDEPPCISFHRVEIHHVVFEEACILSKPIHVARQSLNIAAQWEELGLYLLVLANSRTRTRLAPRDVPEFGEAACSLGNELAKTPACQEPTKLPPDDSEKLVFVELPWRVILPEEIASPPSKCQQGWGLSKPRVPYS